MLSGSEHKDGAEIEETLGTSPPLELRRPASGPRTTITIPHSLQSPQDRATGKNNGFLFISIMFDDIIRDLRSFVAIR